MPARPVREIIEGQHAVMANAEITASAADRDPSATRSAQTWNSSLAISRRATTSGRSWARSQVIGIISRWRKTGRWRKTAGAQSIKRPAASKNG